MPAAPPPEVLADFGLAGPAHRLPGGQGTSWRVGDAVLKPDDGPLHAWVAELVTGLDVDGLRLAAPLATHDGRWSSRGWTAYLWVDGVEASGTDDATWVAVVEAGRTLHRALAGVPRPIALDERTDPWALADRSAWGERPPQAPDAVADLVVRVRPALEPLGHAQLVHADLTGNVLLAPGRPPAVIDLSLYWRPPAYAEGIVVADALWWHGASVSLLDAAGVSIAAVARGLLFRMVTTDPRPDEVRGYARAVDALGL